MNSNVSEAAWPFLRKGRRLIMTWAWLLASHSFLQAQGLQVTGTVTSEEGGESLPGVNILIKGTTIGTVTGGDGNYSINVPGDDATLVFSFIGYATQEVPVNGRRRIDLALPVDIQALDEVVVVGYGTQRKADISGSIAIVDVDRAATGYSQQVGKQLQGRAAGVTVISSGQPGEAPVARIRGINTFGNNDPLYIVDGVPTQDVNTLNPSDIESMQVLKDASASSIYGSRASNGVIVITTKKGKGNVKVKL